VREKLDTKVVFPVEKPLKFTKIFAKAISEATLVETEKYEIKAVIQHKNSNATGNGGHFMTLCYEPESKDWYRFDDSIIKEIKDVNEVIKDSYILVYQR